MYNKRSIEMTSDSGLIRQHTDYPQAIQEVLDNLHHTTWKVIGRTLDTSKKFSFEIKALGKDLCETPP
jgi:hypothetical protein